LIFSHISDHTYDTTNLWSPSDISYLDTFVCRVSVISVTIWNMYSSLSDEL